MIHKLPYNGKWITIDDKSIAKLEHGTEEQQAHADGVRALISQYELNPLKHFLPHGRKWSSETRYITPQFVLPPSTYPEAWGHDGNAFLNDYTSDICLLVAPNQVGKSTLGTIWSALRLLPCDPDWPL